MQRLELMLWLRTERWRKKGRLLGMQSIEASSKLTTVDQFWSHIKSTAVILFQCIMEWLHTASANLSTKLPSTESMGSMWNELFSSHGKDRIDNCTEDVLNTKESCRWGRHSAGLLLVLIIDLAPWWFWSIGKQQTNGVASKIGVKYSFFATPMLVLMHSVSFDTEECGSASERSLKVTCASNSLRSSCWAWQQSPLERT